MKTFASLMVSGLMLVSAAASAGVGPNDNGASTSSVPAGSLLDSGGQTLCTAAINGDGTRAGGQRVVSSTHLGTGIYEVIFKQPCVSITATRGWSRWVQVDTLTTGSTINAVCTTADRAGNQNGVFVSCTGVGGSALDTSFFLFVAR